MSSLAEAREGLGLMLGAEYDLAEMADLFVAELPDRIAKMQAICRSANWQRLGHSTSQLASAAGRLGLDQIQPLADRLDHAVRVREPEQEVLRCLEQLSRLCGE